MSLFLKKRYYLHWLINISSLVKYGSFILSCRSSAEGTRTSKNAGIGNQTRDIQQPTFEDEEIMEYVFSMINSFISSFDQP